MRVTLLGAFLCSFESSRFGGPGTAKTHRRAFINKGIAQ